MFINQTKALKERQIIASGEAKHNPGCEVGNIHHPPIREIKKDKNRDRGGSTSEFIQ